MRGLLLVQCALAAGKYSGTFLNLEDVIGQQAVGLAVNGRGRLGRRHLDDPGPGSGAIP
jgi:hypothetical protein